MTPIFRSFHRSDSSTTGGWSRWNILMCFYKKMCFLNVLLWFQRLQPARGGTAQRKIFLLANWSHLIHPGPSSSRSRFFMESSQSCAATLTHYSTEPLTPGPDYDPLLLLLALAGDVHPNPGPSRYPCSVCFKNVTSQGTCVQDCRIGYIQDVLVFETLRTIVKPMAGSVPPV